MPLYRIEVTCADEEALGKIIADGQWKAHEVRLDLVRSRPICIIAVLDPDTKMSVEVEIRKLETGQMVGIDGSFLGDLVGEPEEEGPLSPYHADTLIVVPDDESEEPPRILDLTQWPFTLDTEELRDMFFQMNKFMPPEAAEE